MTEPRADRTGAIIEIAGLTKHYAGLRPLRIGRLVISRGDRLALGGLDAGAAEMLVHLITGAALSDEGHVRIAGRDTRDIATDTEWLASLDRFGIVTERAVLLEGLTVASNLALPLSLSIDPMPDDIRARVESLAAEVALRPERLAAPVSALEPEERIRVHLARALAPMPDLVLLEHPTARVDDPAASTRLGDTLRRVSENRRLGWLALTEDATFARAAGATRLRLRPATGELVAEGLLGRLLGR